MIRASLIAVAMIWLLVGTCRSASWPLSRTVCTSPFGLVNTKNPTTVVGTGTPSSCNQNALAAAILKGGIITFNCGKSGQAVNITISQQLNISAVNDTIIDGGGTVTLNGAGLTRILSFNRGDFRYATPTLTVQSLGFVNARCQDSNGGCAIFQQNGGTTVIINCNFANNTGPVVGQDVAGGAVWTIGGGNTVVVGSVFLNNQCSNGGGLGILGSGLIIYNSHFGSNQATGNGGNPGNGGNGGAISFDGLGRNNTICGTRFTRNQGNKYGGAFFRVSYNGSEQNQLNTLLVDSNFISTGANGLAGGFYIQGGVVVMINSTIANNSADGAGGLFLASDTSVTLNGVNILQNTAYTGLGGAVFCSYPVFGLFAGLAVANNYAGGFGAAFTFCNGSITLANSTIANNTVANPYPGNACTDVMNNGKGVVQSPINKKPPASGPDTPCANGSITLTNNVSITLNTTTWQIKAVGAPVTYLGPTVIPGL